MPQVARSFFLGGLLLVACAFLSWNTRDSTNLLHGPSPLAVTVHDGAAPVVDSPLALAARYVTIDVSALRWLWWPIILYLFWGMAFVCDVYFVRTIDVISERFQIPDDVAGATLMALGCNGPEMALNTISIFHPSNIGVGAVVGGEVFNVLVIIGTALLATPDMYMPLKMPRFAFFRDVIFYMVSVGLLYWVLRDGNVSRVNAVVLLLGAVCYTTVVIKSGELQRLFSPKIMRALTVKTRTRLSFIPMLSGKVKDPMGVDDDEDDEDDGPDPATLEAWDTYTESADPYEGSILGVRVDVRNRLMDRGHRVDNRYMWLSEDALVVSTVLDPTPSVRILNRAQSGIVYDHGEHAQGNGSHWHHGGLVNQPFFLAKQEAAPKSGNESAAALSQPLLNEKSAVDMEKLSPPPISVPGFKEAPWEVIPLENILYCERPADQKHFNLHVHQDDSSLGHLITLELSTTDTNVMDAWVDELRGKLRELRRRTADPPPPRGCSSLLMEWVEWLQFPVKFFVARTIPDMDDPKLQHLYPVSFFMSMVWLAVFAFSVVKACDGIHEDFGISTDILGFTVAAAGTSFPNVFSGMCVAKQGKTSMAIANALGANVQNVFLALAVPWTIQSFFIAGGPFPMAVDNLIPAVLECAITLAPVVLIYLCCGFSMPKWSGGLYLLTYVVYVIFALGQQVSHCAIWPLPCTKPAA